MGSDAIAAQAVAHAGPRRLATEHGGPRPAGVRADAMDAVEPEPGSVKVPAEERTARITRP